MTRYLYILLVFFWSCFADDRKEFQRRTGLTLTDTTFNIEGIDTYFAHEGEYSIVFKTTKHQIDIWLSNKPPWNNESWSKGQIPHNIGIACQFNFPERVGVGTTPEGKKVYSGNKDLEQLLNDTTNYYAFREDCCIEDEGLRFHDGALLIIQPGTKTIYYSNWNY